MTNIMYISVAIYFFVTTAENPRIGLRTFFSVGLLGVALSSRIIYMVAIPPLLAFVTQRVSLRRAVTLVVGVLAVSAAVTLPVFAPHPIARLLAQLHQNSDKLQLLPPYLPAWSLVAAAFVVATLSFATRMTGQKIYLFLGAATLVMLLPPMALFVRGGAISAAYA